MNQLTTCLTATGLRDDVNFVIFRKKFESLIRKHCLFNSEGDDLKVRNMAKELASIAVKHVKRIPIDSKSTDGLTRIYKSYLNQEHDPGVSSFYVATLALKGLSINESPASIDLKHHKLVEARIERNKQALLKRQKLELRKQSLFTRLARFCADYGLKPYKNYYAKTDKPPKILGFMCSVFELITDSTISADSLSAELYEVIKIQNSINLAKE